MEREKLGSLEATLTEEVMRPFRQDTVPKPPDFEPFDWAPCHSKIVLEIGCGNGMHPIQYATRNQDSTVIAIEQTKVKFDAFAKNLALNGRPTNLEAIRADAIWWCAHQLKPPAKLDEIFFLYPNPNPKESQSNKRFHNMPFMGFLLEHLKSKGRLHLASNIEAYTAEAKTQFVSVWDLDLLEARTLPQSFEARTAFEKKYLERGETCTNLIFQKK